MKKSIFLVLFVAVSISLMGFAAETRADADKPATTMLTVEAVLVDVDLAAGRVHIKGLKLTDEEGKDLFFTGQSNEWFENVNAVRPLTIADGIVFDEFSVNGKSYPIGFGKGTKFVVRKTEAGKYILLPEETMKLSPPLPSGNKSPRKGHKKEK